MVYKVHVLLILDLLDSDTLRILKDEETLVNYELFMSSLGTFLH